MGEVHAVVIQQSSYEVLSASAESYKFIGSRLYYTFDQLVAPEDRALFCHQLQLCSNVQFPLHLLNDHGEPRLYLAAIRASTNQGAAVVSLTPVDELPVTLQQLEHDILIRNHILSLYNDEYFSYDADADKLRIFKASRFEQPILETTADHFLDRLTALAPESSRAQVAQFCRDFRAHSASLYLIGDGNLLGTSQDATITLIKGVSMFNQGQYIGAAGYIHYGSRRAIHVPQPLERDSLTGVLPKGEITNAAISLINHQKAKDTTLAIIDVDYFKQVNDHFGHMGGDAVLRRTASIIEDAVGAEGMVGRIGGDEFMVIFVRKGDMEGHRAILRSIKNRVSAAFPANDPNKPAVTLSIGCAAYPKDAGSYEDVFRLADYALYRAKEMGRNRYVIFDREKHGDPSEIRTMQTSNKRLNNRGNMSVGDIMGAMAAHVFQGEGDPIDQLLEQAVVDLDIQRMMLYAGTPLRAVCTAGEKRPDNALLEQTTGYLNDPALQAMYDRHGILICYDIERIAAKGLPVYRLMKQQGILSFIHLRTIDADGQPVILSLESVSRRITWNENNLPYYSLFQQILKFYHLCKDE